MLSTKSRKPMLFVMETSQKGSKKIGRDSREHSSAEFETAKTQKFRRRRSRTTTSRRPLRRCKPTLRPNSMTWASSNKKYPTPHAKGKGQKGLKRIVKLKIWEFKLLEFKLLEFKLLEF